MEEFIKSKPMLTSGILGTTTTMISGTMASQFGLPGGITALVISFLLGLLVFTDYSIPYIHRFVFYIIISMIIFTTAVGINTAGVAATQTENKKAMRGNNKNNFFHDWFAYNNLSENRNISYKSHSPFLV